MLYSDIGIKSVKDTSFGKIKSEFQTKVAVEHVLVDLNTNITYKNTTLGSRFVYDTKQVFADTFIQRDITPAAALIGKCSWVGYPTVGVGISARAKGEFLNGELKASTLFTSAINGVRRQDFETIYSKNNLTCLARLEFATERQSSPLYRLTGKIDSSQSSLLASWDSANQIYVLISRKFNELNVGLAISTSEAGLDLGVKCELNI